MDSNDACTQNSFRWLHNGHTCHRGPLGAIWQIKGPNYRVGQSILLIWHPEAMAAPRMMGMGLFERAELKVWFLMGAYFSGASVSIMEWTKLEHAFAVEAYFSSDRSIVATQCEFRRHFNIAPRGRVSGRQSIVSW